MKLRTAHGIYSVKKLPKSRDFGSNPSSQFSFGISRAFDHVAVVAVPLRIHRQDPEAHHAEQDEQPQRHPREALYEQDDPHERGQEPAGEHHPHPVPELVREGQPGLRLEANLPYGELPEVNVTAGATWRPFSERIKLAAHYSYHRGFEGRWIVGEVLLRLQAEL